MQRDWMLIVSVGFLCLISGGCSGTVPSSTDSGDICQSWEDCDEGEDCIDGQCIPKCTGTDFDKDGHCDKLEGGDDCNDNRNDIYPGAKELCDGVDNDCDTQTDENCPCETDKEKPCGSNIGVCRRGVQTCANGEWGSCEGGKQPEDDENCDDALDNDCNAAVNDGCPCEEGSAKPCGQQVGECTAGEQTCDLVDANWVWSTCQNAKPPTEENCDDELDNDCDGAINNGCPCESADRPCGLNQGRCRAGTQRCLDGLWGSCEGIRLPQDEVCDGLDNDCDNLTDEEFSDLGEGCESGLGVCAQPGIIVCTSDKSKTTCNATPLPNSSDEICDNKDNDCDGKTDEDLEGVGEECSTSSGVCVSEGIMVCDANGKLYCNAPAIIKESEICDGLDNDCDGETDENFEPLLGEICTVGLGICQADGSWVCSEDKTSLICNAVPQNQSEEICDNLDNDCDGYTNEDWFETCEVDCNGEKRTGYIFCVEGTPGPCSAKSPDEMDTVCNYVDDDCDGETDEDVTPKVGTPCDAKDSNGALALGICASKGFYSCDGQGHSVCSAVAGHPQPEDGSYQTCQDGLDNDCDGFTDSNGGIICDDISTWTNCRASGEPKDPDCPSCGLGAIQTASPMFILVACFELLNRWLRVRKRNRRNLFGCTILRRVACVFVFIFSAFLLPKNLLAQGQCETPNMMIVQDRSGSMVGNKWQQAKNAIDFILNTAGFGSKLRFGLELFPHPMGENQSGCATGYVFVDVGNNTATNIMSKLNDFPPTSGATPMAVTLALLNSFESLKDITRRNYVLLITDGMDSCSCEECTSCECQPAVDSVADLYQNGIKTYVIGFGFNSSAGNPSTLTDMAIAGHTGKYYKADDEQQLKDAMNEILSEVLLEICDDLDNDCDGEIDEGDAFKDKGKLCELIQGDCKALGVYVCNSQHTGLSCNAQLNSQPEICDGLDNDCDTFVDEDFPDADKDGYANCTDCCDSGQENMQGCDPDTADAINPGATESCNGVDDDCNHVIDDLEVRGSCGECVYPGEQPPCWTDQGECRPGVEYCIDGEILCIGEVNPTDEICDKLDNDCDGSTDENKSDEICYDNIDNDCDGYTDEGFPEDCSDNIDNDCDQLTDNEDPDCECSPGNTQECGSDEGECQKGVQVCTEQHIWSSCDEVVEPVDEECDNLDNDCDGLTDEGSLCEGYLICLCGTCAFPCSAGECSGGSNLKCVNNWCVTDSCCGVRCPSGQECVNGKCSDCSQDNCPPKGCFQPGSECPDKQRCVDGNCQDDPCDGIDCRNGKYCREGFCEEVACAACENDQICEEGQCKNSPCAEFQCAQGQVCTQGECAKDPCNEVYCPVGEICKNGHCITDPCQFLHCPENSECLDGYCVSVISPPGEEGRPDESLDGSSMVDSSESSAQDGGSDLSDANLHEVDSGDSGCGCSLSDSSSSPVFFSWIGLAVLLGMIRRRAR